MKTIKILIAAILVLMTASSFAQGKRDPFVTVKHTDELNRFETWVSNIHNRMGYYRQKAPDLPVISLTYYSDYTHISYNNEPFLESWMTEPFQESLNQPFEADGLSDELPLENWMITPFETEELIPIEEWMTTSNWQ
ncbi:MAG: hypothetical protein R6W31_15165 [Bacteroidales bacterium]